MGKPLKVISNEPETEFADGEEPDFKDGDGDFEGPPEEVRIRVVSNGFIVTYTWEDGFIESVFNTLPEVLMAIEEMMLS